MEVMVTTGAIRYTILVLLSSPTQTPSFLPARCLSCHPVNSVKALKGKVSHSTDVEDPTLSWGLPTLSSTTNGSWLSWARVAMPLVSRLMPVCHYHAWNVLIIWVCGRNGNPAWKRLSIGILVVVIWLEWSTKWFCRRCGCHLRHLLLLQNPEFAKLALAYPTCSRNWPLSQCLSAMTVVLLCAFMKSNLYVITGA